MPTGKKMAIKLRLSSRHPPAVTREHCLEASKESLTDLGGDLADPHLKFFLLLAVLLNAGAQRWTEPYLLLWR